MTTKKLYRSEKDKKVAGLVGGLAEFFDIDSTVLRVLAIIGVIVTGVIPGIIAYFVALLVVPKRPEAGIKDVNKEARENVEENKKKIMESFGGGGSISNDDVQKLLGVSDATATRYLDELEKEGKLRQIGDVGVAVRYEKV